jgi:hypothetical protein
MFPKQFDPLKPFGLRYANGTLSENKKPIKRQQGNSLYVLYAECKYHERELRNTLRG